MTVKEFYEIAGGGYQKMIDQFKSDATITMFLKIFKKDKSYATLVEKLEEGNVEEAFTAAHTLKGVVLNLNMCGVIEPAVEVTEALRSGDLNGAKQLLPRLTDIYLKVSAALEELLPA